MAPLFRLFFVGVLVLLGISLSHGSDINSHPTFNYSAEYHSVNKQVISSSDDLRDLFNPFELIEKDEQNEITDEDSQKTQYNSFCIVSNFCFLNLKFFKSLHHRYSERYIKIPTILFILFHCWKLHI